MPDSMLPETNTHTGDAIVINGHNLKTTAILNSFQRSHSETFELLFFFSSFKMPSYIIIKLYIIIQDVYYIRVNVYISVPCFILID